ncbi:MAG: MFS transporter [bacterium]
MSTIVVTRKNGRGCIAADSLTTFGPTRQSSFYDRYPDKIINLQGTYLGIVGSAAHQMVLESVLESYSEKVDFGDRRAIFETFRQLHPVLKDAYFLNPKDEDEDAYESSRIDALIANESGIYGVYSLREVFEYSRFWAVGSGSEYALGAMYGCYDREEEASDIARAGIEAGAEFDTSSALPMTSYELAMASEQAQTVLI